MYWVRLEQGGNLDGCATYWFGPYETADEARAAVRQHANEGAVLSPDGLWAEWRGDRDSGGTPWQTVRAFETTPEAYYDSVKNTVVDVDDPDFGVESTYTV